MVRPIGGRGNHQERVKMSELILNDAGYTHLGTFLVETGELRVTDPCYCPTPRDGRVGVLEHGDGILRVPALNGIWHLRARIVDGGWGDMRTAELQVFHEGLVGHHVGLGEQVGELYVDSGQMGVFDDGRFPREPEQFEYMDETSFYKQACNLTYSDEDDEIRNGGCLAFGGVTSSGFGDGSYPGYVQTDSSGLAISITVEFIAEDEDDEEYDDDDGEGEDDGDEEWEDDDDDDEEPDDDEGS